MPRAGFRSGTLIGRRAKVDGKQVLPSQLFMPQDYNCIGAMISGAITQYYVVSSSALVSGAGVLGWERLHCGKATVTIPVPNHIPPSTKGNFNLYFVTSGSGGTSVMDIDYRVAPICTVSGTFTRSGKVSTFSGAASNATTSVIPLSGVASGLVQKATVIIPKEDIIPNSILKLSLYRDTADAGDTFNGPFYVMATELEYADSR